MVAPSVQANRETSFSRRLRLLIRRSVLGGWRRVPVLDQQVTLRRHATTVATSNYEIRPRPPRQRFLMIESEANPEHNSVDDRDQVTTPPRRVRRRSFYEWPVFHPQQCDLAVISRLIGTNSKSHSRLRLQPAVGNALNQQASPNAREESHNPEQPLSPRPVIVRKLSDLP